MSSVLDIFSFDPRAQWITGACVPVDGGQHKGVRRGAGYRAGA